MQLFRRILDIPGQDDEWRILEATVDDEHGWATTAGRLLREQQYREALSIYRQAQEDTSSEPAVRRQFGRALSQAKRPDDALIAVDRAIEQDPTAQESWKLRGVILSEFERQEEAITSFEHAFEHAKDDASRAILLRGIGNAQWELKRYQQGLETLNRAIALDPTDAPSWSNRGNCLADLGRLEEALASYERALALNPRYAVAWNNKGNTLRHLRRYPEALAALDRAIELDPESGLGWLTKAQTLRDMRAYADAISAYERAIPCAFSELAPMPTLGSSSMP